jgi:hypothetical protein
MFSDDDDDDGDDDGDDGEGGLGLRAACVGLLGRGLLFLGLGLRDGAALGRSARGLASGLVGLRLNSPSCRKG